MIAEKIIEAVRVSVSTDLASKIYWENGCLCVPSSMTAEHVFKVLENAEGIYTIPAVLEYDGD